MKNKSHLLQDYTRRTVLKAGAKYSLAGLGLATLPGCAFLDEYFGLGLVEPGLGAMAQPKGRLYGAAVQSWQLEKPEFAAALKREATLLVPERELKWDVVHPEPNKYDFSGYRVIAKFAKDNNMEMRGHV